QKDQTASAKGPNPPQSGGMLSNDEPLHAKANKMVSTDNNLQVRYDGNAVAWQGSNRLQADVIEIDRENSILKAHGHVISQLLDKSTAKAEAKPDTGKSDTKDASKKRPAPPVLTIAK